MYISDGYVYFRRIRSYVFPMNYHEDKQLNKLQNSLKLAKSCKLQKLLKRKNTETVSCNKQPERFQNLSSEVLDRRLVRVLNKGPSFVNAEPKNLLMFCLKARASLHSATDRLKEQSIPECAMNELKGGMVINECEQLGPEVLKTKKLPYKRPPKHATIIPTHKTKRLISLDTEQYKDMVEKAQGAMGTHALSSSHL